MTTPSTHAPTPPTLAERSALSAARKTRVGMLYAVLAGPALGISFGLLALVVGQPEFTEAAPVGAFAAITLLLVPFGLIGISVFMLITGEWREIARVMGHRVSWWTLFVGVGGFLGDLCYAIGAGLIGGTLAGAIGGLFGIVGAVVTGVIFRTRLLRPLAIVGVIVLAIGLWFVLTGGQLTAPTNGIYLWVGVGVMLFALLTWGFESFAIAAGTDVMQADSFMWWRASLELVIGFSLMLLFFPGARGVVTDVYSSPSLLAYGAIIGIGWMIWMLMGFYIGIAYAGATRGGVLAPSFGFFFVTIFSMTVYGSGLNAAVTIGTIVTFIGAALIIAEPSSYLVRRR